MFQRITYILFAIFFLLASAKSQTQLTNGTLVSTTLGASESRLYEISVPPNFQLRVTFTALAGSCVNATLSDGGALPLSSNSRVIQRPQPGATISTVVSSCSINSADRWYFEVSNFNCSTNSTVELTVTSVLRPCVLAITGDQTLSERVFADEEWAYYSISFSQNTLLTLTLSASSATSTCGNYTLYTRLGSAPTATAYDTIRSNVSSFAQVIQSRAPCDPAGTLYIGVKENCPYQVEIFTAYTLRFQTVARTCIPTITSPFPNRQTVSVPNRDLKYFRFSPAELGINKNASVMFVLKTLHPNIASFYSLLTEYNQPPTLTSINKRRANSDETSVVISYNACNIAPDDIYVGIYSDYYDGLNFELMTYVDPIQCDQPMVPGQIYRGKVDSEVIQRYSVEVDSSQVTGVGVVFYATSAWNYIGLWGIWFSPPAQLGRNDWGSHLYQYSASHFINMCSTPLNATLYIGVQCGNSLLNRRILDYEGRVNFYRRPCIVTIPTSGGVFEESIMDRSQYLFYSWNAVEGTTITIDIISSGSVALYYRLGALPGEAYQERELLGAYYWSWPLNYTVRATGTHYFKISTSSYPFINNPLLASVRFYEPGTSPQFPPTSFALPPNRLPPRAAPQAAPRPLTGTVPQVALAPGGGTAQVSSARSTIPPTTIINLLATIATVWSFRTAVF